MFIAFLLIPIFMLVAVMFLYRFSGKREFLHFDLIQFIYVFLVYPIGYLWLKNFTYQLIRSELGVSISIGEWIALDSIFTIFFLYFYAFGIIHSLTKTFKLNLKKDPLVDLFERSEYFHEVFSHIGMYVGLFFGLVLLSLLNLVFPLAVAVPKLVFYLLLALASLAGIMTYVGAFIFSDLKIITYERIYRRIMKTVFALSFVLFLLAHIVVTPKFNSTYLIYWFMYSLLGGVIVSNFLLNPSRRLWIYFDSWKKDEEIGINPPTPNSL